MNHRHRLWMVFFVALSVIGLETVTFQALSFVNDYLRATQVLSVALMGISLGGVLAWLAGDDERFDVLSLIALPLAILGTLPVVLRLNPEPALMMAVLTVPYVLASFFISRMFSALPAARVYAWDLVGAGLSSVIVVLAIPWLREEGSIFLLGALGSIPAVLMALEKGAVFPRLGAGLGLLGSLVLLVAHLAADPFNMLEHATASKDEYGAKLFHNMIASNGDRRWHRMYSRGSLIERIDIVHKEGRRKKGPWYSVYNGRVVDAITRDKAEVGDLDNRMPTLLKMGEDPDTLLVGPSGQGLCKAIQALGNGHIDAVEINGAIGSLMADEMFKRSGKAYGGMDLHIGDVRTFLETTDRLYDYITMLNTHRIWSMGHQGPPEYVHTLEAMHSYVDHLEDDGFLVFEERNINERAELGIRRMVHTAKAALVDRGVADPTEHFAIWELYHGCTPNRWMSTPKDPASRCPRRKLFTFVMVKKTPITAAEEAHLLEWGELLGARKPGSSGDYRGIVWRYLPGQDSPSTWADVVRVDDLYELGDVDRATHNLGIVTDDVPYPYDVFHDREGMWELLGQVTRLSLLMVLVPGMLAFFGTRRRGEVPAVGQALTTGVLLAFFAVLGLGYLLVEVVLIQKLGIFLSSPVTSLAIVLGTMLVASGLGGAFSARLGRNQVLGAMALTLVLIGLVLQSDPVLQLFFGLPLALRAVVAMVLVGPLAFLMGMPFPHAMGFAKERLSGRHAGLMFAVNGALSAIAAPVCLLLSMMYGFHNTLLVAGGLYLVCTLLLALVPRR